MSIKLKKEKFSQSDKDAFFSSFLGYSDGPSQGDKTVEKKKEKKKSKSKKQIASRGISSNRIEQLIAKHIGHGKGKVKAKGKVKSKAKSETPIDKNAKVPISKKKLFEVSHKNKVPDYLKDHVIPPEIQNNRKFIDDMNNEWDEYLHFEGIRNMEDAFEQEQKRDEQKRQRQQREEKARQTNSRTKKEQKDAEIAEYLMTNPDSLGRVSQTLKRSGSAISSAEAEFNDAFGRPRENVGATLDLGDISIERETVRKEEEEKNKKQIAELKKQSFVSSGKVGFMVTVEGKGSAYITNYDNLLVFLQKFPFKTLSGTPHNDFRRYLFNNKKKDVNVAYKITKSNLENIEDMLNRNMDKKTNTFSIPATTNILEKAIHIKRFDLKTQTQKQAFLDSIQVENVAEVKIDDNKAIIDVNLLNEGILNSGPDESFAIEKLLIDRGPQLISDLSDIEVEDEDDEDDEDDDVDEEIDTDKPTIEEEKKPASDTPATTPATTLTTSTKSQASTKSPVKAYLDKSTYMFRGHKFTKPGTTRILENVFKDKFQSIKSKQKVVIPKDLWPVQNPEEKYTIFQQKLQAGINSDLENLKNQKLTAEEYEIQKQNIIDNAAKEYRLFIKTQQPQLQLTHTTQPVEPVQPATVQLSPDPNVNQALQDAAQTSLIKKGNLP